MNYGEKSQKRFLAITLVTVLSIFSVITVYAVVIGTFTGGEVTVGTTGSGNIMYASDNVDSGTWTSTLTSSGAGVAWYSRLEITAGGYSGPVTITWHLENKTGSLTWADIVGATASTSMVLTGGAQTIYATSDGVFSSGNYNWGAQVTRGGAYRVMVDVASA